MRRLIATSCFLLIGILTYAQDPHFSQFFSSPLTLNPAFTGKFSGTFRAAGNYRNQWPTINNAYITTTGSVDFHLRENHIPQNDTWGIGGLFYSDNSANGAVRFNYATLSTAYHKGLDEEGYHQLGLGFQVTSATMSINTNALQFEDQLTTAGFTGVTQEIFSGATLSANYIDVNTGILYSGSTTDKNNFYFGVSLYHVNRPKQSFVGGNYVLNPRATIHAGTYFPLGANGNTILHLSGMQTFQGGASETVVGGAIQLVANPEEAKPTSIYLGSWMRFNDAIIPYLGLEFGDVRLGATYDVNSSSLKTASQRQGGIEISLVYILKKETDKNIPCPRF
jgi:type IX secretion system PorP/SprF family membrane protein